MLSAHRRPRALSGLGSGLGQNPYETVHGDDARDKDAVFNRLQSLGLLDDTAPITQAPQASAVPDAPANLAQPLPQAPPSARSTDPWSKDNRSRTLLDISAAFGGANTFGEGLGRAAGAIGGRMDQLKAEATPQRRQGVGPDGSFEAITDPVTGETTFQRIQPFVDVIDAERERKRAEELEDRKPVLTPEQIMEDRARVMFSIQQLPEGQRAMAYRRLIADPASYGGINTEGMPSIYDPNYAASVSNLGMTQQQLAMIRLREEDLERKREADRVRAAQGDRRIRQSPANRPRSSPRPPSGFILD